MPRLPPSEPRSRASRRRLAYAALAAAILAGAAVEIAVAANDHTAPAVAIRPAPALTVTAATPHRITWPVTLVASGAIAPWQEASIGTQIGGYQLIEVRVNVGDRVRKGEVLARLDPALLKADEAQLEASYDQAEANRKRALELKASGGISKQDILQYVTQAKTAAALLASKRLQLRYTDVVAPDDGTISARTATLGAVEPVGQELFRLIRQDRLEWRGELTAAQLAQIEPGQRITLTLPDGSRASARVRETAPSLDGQSRLGIVYADLEPGGRARAGMYASGAVTLGERPGLAVPAEAIVIRDGRSYVLKLADPSMTPSVTLTPVTVGRRNGPDAEITGSLSDTDRVVVQGAGFLNDGDVVRLSAPPGPGAQAAQETRVRP